MRPQTKLEFEIAVETLMRTERLSFVLATYRLVDEMTAEELARGEAKLACCSGCSFCCHQLVSATPIEWLEIKKYLRVSGLLLRMRQSFSFMKASWYRYYQQNQRLLERDMFKAARDYLGKPCVFLGSSGECVIYPVRPIDCRTMTSTVRCTQWQGQEGAKRFRYEWEKWANNLILEEAIRQSGNMAVTPLTHWLSIMSP